MRNFVTFLAIMAISLASQAQTILIEPHANITTVKISKAYKVSGGFENARLVFEGDLLGKGVLACDRPKHTKDKSLAFDPVLSLSTSALILAGNSENHPDIFSFESREKCLEAAQSLSVLDYTQHSAELFVDHISKKVLLIHLK